MRIIGLTGGIAAGKSAVSDRLARMGAVVIDTDLLAREVVEPGTPGLGEIVAAFGPSVLNPDGTLARAVLAERVFSDPRARETLNAITHPRIRALMAARVDQLRSSTAPPPAVVLVVPLLFENGLDASVDESWVVDVPEATQGARLAARNGLSEAEVKARLASQWGRAARLAKAQRVISNEGTLGDLDEAVARAWREAGLDPP